MYLGTVMKECNKTLVYCTDTHTKVKAVILKKDDHELVVDLPSGYQMVMTRKPKRKLYVHLVGTLEFVSDGWAQT